MKLEVKNNELHITLVGSLTATNAPEVEAKVKEVLSPTLNKVIIDANSLDYISSAGLRVLLTIAKVVKDTTVINVNRDVYDVFEMTGFITFLKVERKLREISLDGATVLGEGATAIVYRLDADTIVKVFREERTVERVREEISLAKKAFIYGIPTAISFDIVKVGDRLGVVFELIDSKSVCESMKDDPEHLDKYIDILVNLLLKLRNTDASDSGLRNAKDYYLDQLETIKDMVDPAMYEKMKRLLNEMENKSSLIHGDFHIKNIMVQNGEPLLIDMDTVSIGNQIFEYGSFYIAYCAYPETEPGNTLSFFGLSEDVCLKIYNDSIRKSFPNASEEELELIKLKIMAVGSIRMCFFCKEFKENELRTSTTIKHFNESVGRLSDLNLPF